VNFPGRLSKGFFTNARTPLALLLHALVFATLCTVFEILMRRVYVSYDNILGSAEFYPLNGKFQAFNPVRRLLEGQLPGRDFVAYTGLGPALSIFLSMVWSKCTSFSCSVFFGEVLSFLAGALLLAWVFYLSLRATQINLPSWLLFFFSGVSGLALAFPIKSGIAQVDLILESFIPLNVSGVSQISLRSLGATLTSIVVYILLTRHSQTSRRWVLISASPLLFLWSNDYGLWSWLYLMFVAAIAEFRDSGLSRRFLSSTALSFFYVQAALAITVFLVSGGHPIEFLARHLFGIIEDQMWYFLPHDKVLLPRDITGTLPPHGEAAVVVTILLSLVILRPLSAVPYSAAALGAITLMAGVASQVGGHLDNHYLWPFKRAYYPMCLPLLLAASHAVARIFLSRVAVSWVLGGSCLGLILAIILGASASRLEHLRQQLHCSYTDLVSPRLLPFLVAFLLLLISHGIAPKKYGSWRLVLRGSIIVILVFNYVVRAPLIFSIWPAFASHRDASAIKCHPPSTDFVPELGGCLEKNRARALRSLLSLTKGSSDLFSTYSSAFDVMSGAFNSSGSDYIIHALGASARAKYEKIVEERKHQFITTLRENFTFWESWARRMNWGFYRALLRNYHAVASTDYNVLWERNQSPGSIFPGGSCDILDPAGEAVRLRVTPPPQLKEAGYLDLMIEYDVSGPDTFTPPYVIRTYATVDDGWVERGGRYGIPSARGYHRWSLPVEFQRLGESVDYEEGRIITLRVSPKPAGIHVTNCRSEFSVPLSRFSAPELSGR
jgi:hypothetical protein